MKKTWKYIYNHGFETITILLFILAIVFIMFTVHSCVKDIEEAGGIRHIIVEAGKETKLLAEDINKAVEEHHESEKK